MLLLVNRKKQYSFAAGSVVHETGTKPKQQKVSGKQPQIHFGRLHERCLLYKMGNLYEMGVFK